VRIVLLERQLLPTPTLGEPLGGEGGMGRSLLHRTASGSLLGGGNGEGDGDAPSALGLRGVTPVGGSSRRYEVHLGQQSYGSGTVQWELWVENTGDQPLRYRLFALTTEEGEEWVSFSRSSGILPSRHETHMITLDCSTQQLDIHSTYVVIENVDDPRDVKTVHVSMRMVVSDAPASSYFSVIVDSRVRPTSGGAPMMIRGDDAIERQLGGSDREGRNANAGEKRKELKIDMGEVYYGVVYRNRSFVVENKSQMPLDFVISHNLQGGPAAATEVNFSLSNTALKVFSTLVVPPLSSTRVYIHMRAAAPREPSSTSTSLLSASTALAARQRDWKGARDLAAEISISCRLVKDHRTLVHLSAVCHPAQLSVSPSADLPAFTMPRLDSAMLNKGRSLLSPAPSARVEPRSTAITVANLGATPLRYAVRQSCTFFVVHAPSEGEPIAEGKGGGTHTITVTPNERAIQSHLPMLAKTRFIEEHFTVYNLADLTEHKCVHVRLSCGQLPAGSIFTYSPSESASLLGYSALEEEITRFHCDFTSLFDPRITAMLAELKQRERDASQHASQHGGDRFKAMVWQAAPGATATAGGAGSGCTAAGGAATATTHSDAGAGAISEEPAVEQLFGGASTHSGELPDLSSAALAPAALGGVGGAAGVGAAEAEGSGGGDAAGGGDAGSARKEDDATTESSRQLAALLNLLDEASLTDDYQRLWFNFRHITDELVFYGMVAQSDHLITPLANLCYKMLFRHEVFEIFTERERGTGGAGRDGASQPRSQRRLLPLGAETRGQLPPKLLAWVKQLSYFLMHFPDVEGGIAPLRRLHRSLVVVHRRRELTEARHAAQPGGHDEREEERPSRARRRDREGAAEGGA
jgi:hypothetical protein